MINLVDSKIVCEADSEKFTWHYRFDENFRIIQIASKTFQCPFIGHGEYICTIDSGQKFVLNLKKGVNIYSEGHHVLKTENHKWNFEKLTEVQRSEIKELFDKKDLKGLIKFHNSNELSDSHYCCNGEFVYSKFKYGFDNGLI